MPYTVFPLHPLMADGSCGCHEGAACERPGKHPAIRWGELEAGAQVLGGFGHGIVTGAKSGIFVVDTDGEAADARFRALGEIPPTFTVRTPSGGRHYYFAHPGHPVRCSQGEYDWREDVDGFDPETGRKVSTKIDVRGDGGFVVAPGSPHKSGRAYEVENNVPPATAPAHVLTWPGLVGRTFDTEGAWRPIPVDLTSEIGKKRLEMGREACATMEPSVAGQNGSASLWAISLRLVRDLELPLDASAELIATIFNPRCEPAWSTREIEHKLIDARDKSDRMPGNVTDFDLSKASKIPTVAPVAARKKTRDPSHTYEAKVGDVPNGAKQKVSAANAASILRIHPSWDGVLQYDAFRDRIIAIDPPIKLDAETTSLTDADVVRVRVWFELVGGMLLSKDTAFEAVVAVARENAFHPVREWLTALPPVRGEFLEDAAARMFGTATPLEGAIVKRFLVAAVRRIMNPGTKVDTMLVLAGPQGVGKSTFVRALFGEDWTAEDMPSLESKDAIEVLRGKWAIEVAELDKILKSEAETAKAFLSRCVDTFRPSYGRNPEDRARECVFVGTTNRDDILRDATGSRRFWIVDVRRVDLAWIRANRDAIFAAALDLVKRGEPHWLAADEEARRQESAKAWEERDPWHEPIATYCTGREVVRVDDVFRHVGGTTDKLDRRLMLRITDTLRRLGCVQKVIRVAPNSGRERGRVWVVPEDLRTGELPPEEIAKRASLQVAVNLAKN